MVRRLNENELFGDYNYSQEYYIERVKSIMDDCKRIPDLANRIAPLYNRLGEYLKQTNLDRSYLNRIGKLNSDIMDAWALLDQAKVVVSDLIRDIETFDF